MTEVGIRGVHVCESCERQLRDERDEFLVVSRPDGENEAYCDSCASKAVGGLGRRDGL
jgi:hypothetical protein